MPWSISTANHTINIMTTMINRSGTVRKCIMSVIMIMFRRMAIKQVPRDVIVKVAKAVLVIRIAVLMTAMRE